METALQSSQKRNVNLDLLRLISCTLVILVHTSSIIAYMAISDNWWKTVHVYNSLAHSGNILFLMISGSLLLSESYRFEAKKFYTHNFLKLAVSYLLWLIIFNVIGVVRFVTVEEGSFSLAVVQDAVKNVIRGIASYQFWFIPMLLGLYLLLPMLRAICHAEKWLAPYFVGLFLTAYILFQTILYFDFPHKYLFESVMTRIPFTLINHYAGYFVMGYLLAGLLRKGKIRHGRTAGILLIAAGILLSLMGDLILAAQHGSENSLAMNEMFSLCPCMIASGFFLFINSLRLPEGRRLPSLLQTLSSLTFGVYMLHPLLLSPIRALIEGLQLPLALEIPLETLLLLICCMAAVYVLSLIPFLRKWLLFIGRKS